MTPFKQTAPPQKVPVIPSHIFRAYDIRGIVGDTLTAGVATSIGRAIGTTAVRAGYRTLVVGRDGRLSSPDLSETLITGLCLCGIEVIDVSALPTPLLSYAIAHFGADGGVMVTGSHNPKNHNGFKITLGDGPLYGDQILALAELIGRDDFVAGEGRCRQADGIIETYIAEIAQKIRLHRKLTVAIDCGNGITGAVAPALYRRLGCEVIELFSAVDGNFPNHHPDPAKPENLANLIEAIADSKAEVGLAFDGDGDRLGVVTQSGEIIFPDRQMMLFAQDVLMNFPGAPIVFDVKSTQNLGRWIKKHGGRPVLSRTGHSYLRAKMREIKAPLAGEMSGHLFFADRWYGFDDGLYAGARLLEILSTVDRAIDKFNELPTAYSTPEIQIPMAEGEPAKLVELIAAQASHFSDAESVTLIDGLRADYSDGFGLVRSSNTTPTLVLRFEGQTTAALLRIQRKFKTLMQSLVPSLSLPF